MYAQKISQPVDWKQHHKFIKCAGYKPMFAKRNFPVTVKFSVLEIIYIDNQIDNFLELKNSFPKRVISLVSQI